jgi:hypothetical protein
MLKVQVVGDSGFVTVALKAVKNKLIISRYFLRFCVLKCHAVFCYNPLTYAKTAQFLLCSLK